MESTQQPQQQALILRIWPFLVLLLGFYRLGDWLYGGRQDLSSLLAGVGFLLMVPGAFFQRKVGATGGELGTRRLLLWLTVVGLGFIICAIAHRWL
jgi:hypothetical protein